jgi:predicted DNA-binding protein (MmcQ/YjbR family)
VDGKLFVVAAMEMVPQRISFKCTPENFAELCERPGIIPAPYMARAQWVSLERLNARPDSELREMISESYRLVWERLPRKRRAELESDAAVAKRPAVSKPKTASRKSSVKAKSAGKTKSAKAARRK